MVTTTKKSGHHRAAINNESDTLFELDGYVFFSIMNENKSSESLDTFKQILIFSQANRIDLHLFISPEHARKLVLINQLGLWQEFELWKRNLVTLIAENAPEFSLWDFSGFNNITTEPFPALNDSSTQMQWYWESSHYKKEVGNIILGKMLAENTDSQNYPADFGIQINSTNIDYWLQQTQLKRNDYIKNNPEITAEIMKMVVDTASKRVLLLKQNPDLQAIDYFQLESTATH